VSTATGRNSSNRQPENEEGSETVEEKPLPRMAFPDVRPNEWERNERGNPVEHMDRVLRSIAPKVEHQAGSPLRAYQSLADCDTATDRPIEDAAPGEGEEAPETNRAHEQQHSDREAIMNDQHGIQSGAPRLTSWGTRSRWPFAAAEPWRFRRTRAGRVCPSVAHSPSVGRRTRPAGSS
jgi:hypothetical protein